MKKYAHPIIKIAELFAPLWLILTLNIFLIKNLHASENLTSLISDARILDLDSANAPRERFSDSQITEFLNQGQRQAMAMTHCLQGSEIINLVPGTTYYPLPANFDYMNRVTIGVGPGGTNNHQYLLEQSPAALDGRSRGWESASGYPTYYFINFSSRGLVGFAPFPNASSDTDTVKLEYFIQANELVNGSDVPFNNTQELQEYDHALAYYAAAIMETIDNQPQSASYMGLYNGMIATMKTQCYNRPNYSPSMSATP